MADVTIRGAGIFGLSIAWECLGRGASVCVIDPGGIGAGASGGLLGTLSPHTPGNWNDKKQVQFDSLIAAEAFWAGVDAASGLSSGYGRVGRLQPIADDRALELALARADQASEVWRGKAVWRVIPAAEARAWAGAWVPLSPTCRLIHDTLSARLHPRRACRSLATAIAACGGEIAEQAPDAGAVIRATGYQGLQELSQQVGRTVGNGQKGQAALLGYEARGMPQLFAGGVHIVAHEDGTVAVGSTSEREFDDPNATDTALDQVIGAARTACPALRGAPVLERWAGVRPRAISRAPVLGRYPGRQGQFIANGGFKTGFGMAPAIAALMADLVLDGHDRIPEAFRVSANLQLSANGGVGHRARP